MAVEKLWIKLMMIGSKMGCHQCADRSFYIKKYQLPVCARCSGIILSTIPGYVICLLKPVSSTVGIILCIPMIVDGSLQYFDIKESSNLRRFLSGLLGGIGLTILRYCFVCKVIKVASKIIEKC